MPQSNLTLNAKFSARDWATLEEALLLSPSSGGVQPWKFIVITDPEMRAKLRPKLLRATPDHDRFPRVVFAVEKTILVETDIDALN